MRRLENGRLTASSKSDRCCAHCPAIPFDTDEIVPAVVSPHARVEFDGNRYSVPPHLARQTVTIRADGHEVRVLHQGQVVAQHVRCYERRQLIVLPDHRLAALALEPAVAELGAGTGV